MVLNGNESVNALCNTNHRELHVLTLVVSDHILLCYVAVKLPKRPSHPFGLVCCVMLGFLGFFYVKLCHIFLG